MPELNRREPDNIPAQAKAAGSWRDIGQRASIAQILLLARLRARNRRDLAVDSLERAAQVIFVTCKHWFAADQEPVHTQAPAPEIQTPAIAMEEIPAMEENADAHRHH